MAGMLPALVTLAVASAIVVVSGGYLVRFLERGARAAGVSEYVVAFLFLAVGTSVPELFVSASSALEGLGDMVIAIALGSNVVNMTLILGLAAVLSFGIATSEIRARRDLLAGGAITALPILFLLNGTISRFEGVALLLVFVGYMVVLYRGGRIDGQADGVPRNPRRALLAALASVAMIALLVGSSKHAVTSAATIAEGWNLPAFLIGLFVFAVGTSLPELTTTVRAALRGKSQIALGNVLGSNVGDSALVIGAAAVIRPLTISSRAPAVTVGAFVLLALLAVGIFAWTKRRISFWEGLFLIGIFGVFVLAMLVFGGLHAALPVS